MGEASAGRSATSPTFFRSTSVRTKMEWQNSHVVWTALDQRNTTGAPQLGQFAIGALMAGRDVRIGGRRLSTRRIPSSAAPQNPCRGAAGNRRDSGKAIH